MFERAIIIAGDSLYSDEMGRPLCEDGLKLMPLAKNAGAVFAGDVAGARKALEEIKLLMSGLGSFSLDQFGTWVRGYFDTEVPRDKDVECLIGITGPTTEPHILKLSSHDRFIPHYSRSYQLIGGHMQAEAMFTSLLDDKQRLSGGYSEPSQMSLRVLEALDSTIHAHYQAIGGKVQCAIVTRDGLLTGQVWDIEVFNNPPSTRRFTLRPDETR